MNTIHTRWRRIALLTCTWAIFFATCGSLVFAAAWSRLPAETVAHNISLATVDVSMLSRADALQKLEHTLPDLSQHTLTLTSQDKTWSTPSASLGLQWDTKDALDSALQVGRRGSWVQQQQERIGLAFAPIHIPVQARYNQEILQAYIATISAQVDTSGKEPAIQVSGGRYDIDPGEAGYAVEQQKILSFLLQNPLEEQYALPVQTTVTSLTTDELEQTQTRLGKLWGKSLLLTVSELEPSITIPASEFFAWLELPSGFKTEALMEKLQEWNASTLREPVNAEFVRGAGQRLEKFQPHQTGRALDQEELETQLLSALLELEKNDEKSKTLTFPFFETEPTVPLADTNDLGITERIGLGTSTYAGSIPNRVYNVDHTAEIIGAVLIAPGEEYSFAQTVGDISSASGFKSAYVIRNGRTELGDGGGVCQVSTTIFRAVLDAGLPITRWKNHSYRVGYYEQGNKPGFDATIYAPSVDFRFTNDTGNYLVLVPENNSDERFLRIEIWGTNDGRESSIENYSLTNVRSAPAPLYQEDPSLPVGTRRQIDWAAPGATAKFDYKVRKNGEILHERTFTSIYKPWQAVFLVGTGQ